VPSLIRLIEVTRSSGPPISSNWRSSLQQSSANYRGCESRSDMAPRDGKVSSVLDPVAVMRSAVRCSLGHNPHNMNSIACSYHPFPSCENIAGPMCPICCLDFPRPGVGCWCFLLPFKSLWSLVRGDSKNCIEQYILIVLNRILGCGIAVGGRLVRV
jgi:hypothetical protein